MGRVSPCEVGRGDGVRLRPGIRGTHGRDRRYDCDSKIEHPRAGWIVWGEDLIGTREDPAVCGGEGRVRQVFCELVPGFVLLCVEPDCQTLREESGWSV